MIADIREALGKIETVSHHLATYSAIGGSEHDLTSRDEAALEVLLTTAGEQIEKALEILEESQV